MNKYINKNKIKWWILMLVAITGIVLMIITTYVTYKPDSRIADGIVGVNDKNPDGDFIVESSYRLKWQEMLQLPYYFTFISNVMGFVIAVIYIFNDSARAKLWFQRFKIMATVNLLVTMVVFWILLSASFENGTQLERIQDIFVHVATPSLMIIVFIWDSVVSKSFEKKIGIANTAGINFLMPLIWLWITFVMYIVLGAANDKTWTRAQVPYSFLDVVNAKWWVSLSYIAGIGVGYVALTIGATWFYKIDFKKIKKANL